MTQDIQRWADGAMWLSEPVELAEGEPLRPKATLISMTHNPLRVMAAAAELYKGRVVRDAASISAETAMKWWKEMTATRLQAPLEFIDLHFLLENVSRAFTHQLVRQRTAVYVQESMRFAVKENAEFEVAMPPFIASLDEDDPRRVRWTEVVQFSATSYNALTNAGVPAEDARGLLPTNIVTRVHYKTNLRNLAEHAGNRLCTQAQFEWRLVWGQMIQAIRQYDPPETVKQYRSAEYDDWQYRLIADMFRPICYQTGKCEFMGSNDRYCSIRERVNAHHARNEPSSEWSDIHPAEWIADPTAARKV